MIKRPLVWILGAYLTGMYLAWNKYAIAATIILFLCLCLLFYLFMYRITNKFINRHDKFLWSLPLLLLLGFCSMRGQLIIPKLYEAFDQEVSCELSGRITMIVTKQWGKAIYVKDDTVSLSEGDLYVCENVIVFCYDSQGKSDNQRKSDFQSKSENQGKSDNQGKSISQDISLSKKYLVGNQITVHGTLQKFGTPTNPGQFNEKLYYQIENIDFKMKADNITVTDAGYSRYHAYLDKIKNKLLLVYESILSGKESGTLIAMLLGEKYLLEDEIKQLYQVNGISHVLAISGLHVSLIGMAVFYLLKKCKLPIILATFFAIFCIYSYGVMTNFSVSTNRAVVMMTIMFLAALIGKTYDMLSALALSALIILIQNPIQILSAGFLLSFGAVLGIAIIFPSLQKLFPSKNSIVSGLFISLSAQVTTTPFVLYFFYQFPVYGIFTNLIILPFVTVLTLTSIIAGIAGAIYLPFGIFLIGGANYILKFYEWICRIGSRLPGNLITIGRPHYLKLIIYMLLLAVFLWAAHKQDELTSQFTCHEFKKWYSVFIIAIAFIILILPGENVGLEITVLDVGQGDGIYMESENRTSYFIDGGSTDVKKVGINRIQPFLLSQGEDCIDYAIMTHSDNDHISGLSEMMEAGKIQIRNLVLPNIKEKDEAYMELEALAKKMNITVRYISTGDVIKDGKLQMLCLHPVQGYEASNSNSYSTVLSISYGEFDMLLTGDLQQDGEEAVIDLLQNQELWNEYDRNLKLQVKPAVDYDILKVAHHGSKYSTFEEFLRLIKPEYSLISCGRNNFYGHPHKELLERLSQAGSKMMITYETGAITIKTDGKMVKIKEFIGCR